MEHIIYTGRGIMIADKFLKNHLESSQTVHAESLVVAEWNMNIPLNIYKIGNYRYRPSENLLLAPENRSRYSSIQSSFDPNDDGNFYTNATDADVVVDGGYRPGSGGDIPLSFISKKQKDAMLFSLEDCFGKFRPRSGINKLRYFEDGFSHFSNLDMCSRPRYYLADKDDKFKYWSSFRTESNVERGIANKEINSMFYIDDASPFVVYNSEVPANRVVVKLQTNVGTVDLGPFNNGSESLDDPFYGDANMSIPKRWKIQYLQNNSWLDMLSFNEYSTRSDGSQIFGPNGYLQINYGLIVPTRYRNVFKNSGSLIDQSLLPDIAFHGQAYFVNNDPNNIGQYFIWFDQAWESFVPEYGWYIGEEEIADETSFVTNLVYPQTYYNNASSKREYREFVKISGLRLVVESMNKKDSTLDLIELSPRLASNISNIVSSYSIKKPASDIGVSGMPVGQLLASTGSIEIFDADGAFNINNPNSIIAKYTIQNTQFKFYESIKNVPVYDEVGNFLANYNYYVPVKTMYSDGFPTSSESTKNISIGLRDLFFYFESMTAPQILIQNVSLSYAITILMDNIGFSNYAFKRLPSESDPVIPFFFIPPDTTVAQVLSDLAISTQSAMFLDEHNNFIVMSKGWMMPSEDDRATDLVFYGKTANGLSNIAEIATQNSTVYNAGNINYTTRYIQRSYGSLDESLANLSEKTWEYKPVLLWEATPTESIRPQNGEISQASGYALSAVPLNSDLTDELPYVVNGVLKNNTMDFGEGVYWVNKHNGYFYSNGEVIKYDAIEYSIPGTVIEDSVDGSTVWISSAEEFEKYFGKVSFNGKIYPTGRVRIYTEPYYEEIEGITKLKDGPVAKHGRCQFGTGATNSLGELVPVYHYAGLNSYWSDINNVRGCQMDSSYIFSDKTFDGTLTTAEYGNSFNDNAVAQRSFRNGIIKNFLSNTYIPESEISRKYVTENGVVQSSAFVMTGGNFTSSENQLDYVSYVYKEMNDSYKHFGTRMRIVGRVENNSDRPQSPIGSTGYYIVSEKMPNENITISGASGGLGILINEKNNAGYYFEIAALTENNIINYEDDSVHDVIFYKVYPHADSSVSSPSKAIPEVLWSGYAGILVDDGTMVGARRSIAEDVTTVYDLAVEYIDIGSTRRFYLYLNDNLVATVTDTNPLPQYNSMAMFVRGRARCMFENLYALTQNYSQNTGADLNLPANSVFTNGQTLTTNSALRKYAINGILKDTYLSNISSIEPSKYKLYYEEFGSIMREASYFNVKYDLAYPALYSKISPTGNMTQSYVVSGFLPTSYGAEFIVFNATDSVLLLDGTEGNFLRIQGVTFTQESNNEMTVDKYFNRVSDFSDPKLSFGSIVDSPIKATKQYDTIRNSRIMFGKNEFSISAPYIQTQEFAESMMGWIVEKIMAPRLSVGLRVFPNPMLQLGDVVSIDHKANDDSDIIDSSKRFVIYDMEYSRNNSGPEMTVYLSEIS